MSDLEIKLGNLFDMIYMLSDSEEWRLEVGIWQASDNPFTFYALLKNGDALEAGETSYGSDTPAEAILTCIEEWVSK